MVRFNKLITTNTIFRDRCAGLAVVTAEEAIAWGLVGPNLRGSGVDWDLRRDEPYGLYGELGVRVPTGQNVRRPQAAASATATTATSCACSRSRSRCVCAARC
jgi:hypothetical protein